MHEVTAVTVVCNTEDLFEQMYRNFRKFHPDMLLIVIDNSDKHSQCREYIAHYASDITKIYQISKNIGHGKGLDFAIRESKTDYVLIMDTDTVILKDPLPEMFALMDDDTYGVGCITQIAKDGYDFGVFKHHQIPIPYLHPFFALIRVSEYAKYKPFAHHGAPWFRAARDMHEKKESYKIKHFDGLKAFEVGPRGLIAARTDYVFHDFGGTRRKNKSMGRDEIQQGWER